MTEAQDRAFDSFEVGEEASFERTISTDDVAAFAELTGDHNPLHMDDAYAQATNFGSRVVHGMFLAGLVSRLVGMQMPGKRALLMKESLEFKKPVHIGDRVHVEGVVTHTSPATHIVELGIQISVKGELVATGQVQVQVRAE